MRANVPGAAKIALVSETIHKNNLKLLVKWHLF
jgi:hypothetical protein